MVAHGVAWHQRPLEYHLVEPKPSLRLFGGVQEHVFRTFWHGSDTVHFQQRQEQRLPRGSNSASSWKWF